MIMTTTPNIEGKKISKYFGVVTGEAIMGANLFRDLFAGIRDIVGGRSGAYEKELRKAREIAFQEIEAAAMNLNANAVVGMRFSTSMIMQGASEMVAFGTAVKLK